MIEYLIKIFYGPMSFGSLNPERPLEKESLHIHKSHIEMVGTVTDFVACLQSLPVNQIFSKFNVKERYTKKSPSYFMRPLD